MSDFDDDLFPACTRDLMPPSQKNLLSSPEIEPMTSGTETYVPKTQPWCRNIFTTLLKHYYLYKNNIRNFKQNLYQRQCRVLALLIIK